MIITNQITVIQTSKVHGRLRVHRSHRHTSARSLTVVEVALGLRDFVPLDPLSAVLLRNSHFDPIFVDALDDSSVALQGSTSNSDGLSHFEVFFFSHKPRFNIRFEASSCFF